MLNAANNQYYPSLSFPLIAQAAIADIQRGTQAPLPMIGSSVLAAMSLAVQAQFRVKRREGLESPCSLALVSICASGERKTTVDKIVTSAFLEFEAKQSKTYDQQHQDYQAKKVIWETQKRFLLRRFEKAVKEEVSLQPFQSAIEEHERQEPKPPRKTRIIYNDVTSAALLHGLHKNTRSAALSEDEAARFFSGQLSEDASLINKGWDGSRLTVDRRTTESFSIEAPRITLNLMVQPAAFEKFMERKGEDARGVGFIARWLVCHPLSTQGTRFISNEISETSGSRKFSSRISELLEQQAAIGALENNLSEITLTFSPEAEREWINVANQIESAIQPGGLFCSAHDYASKVAENIARIAGVFHAFSGHTNTQISYETLNAAVSVAQWYATEFVRLFAPADPLLPLVKDAILLEDWLIKVYCQRRWNVIEKNFILQCGPNPLRNRDRLSWALNHLVEKQRVLVNFVGKRKQIVILNQNYFQPLANNFVPIGFLPL